MVKRKIITLLLVFLGVLIIPAGVVYYSLPKETLETTKHNCCKEDSHPCKDFHHKCIVPCVVNYTFVSWFQIKITRIQGILIHKKQTLWYYQEKHFPGVYSQNWVPPKFI